MFKKYISFHLQTHIRTHSANPHEPAPRFSPKEDIASSTSIKSSIQRQIRTKLITQYPLLSAPSLPLPPTHHANDDSDASDDDDEPVVEHKREKGAGVAKREKAAKKGGKGGKGKKGRGEEKEEVEEKEEKEDDDDHKDGELTLLDVLWPKKEGLTLIKCREHLSILALHGEPLFFQHFDGPFFPTLKLLHRYPELLPHVQVDRGAIKFVLAGANIMCPGLTSPTASLPSTNVPTGTPVAVHAYGKQSALAIGLTSMSTDDIKSINKGCGVENVVYLGDDLWGIDKI